MSLQQGIGQSFGIAGSDRDYRIMVGYIDGAFPKGGAPSKPMVKYCKTYRQLWYYHVGYVKGMRDWIIRREAGYEV